jgi:predicted NBD/HSP70 family sugar kinase
MPNASTGGYFSEATVFAGAACDFGENGCGFHKRANMLCFGLSTGAAGGVVLDFAVTTAG